MRRYTTAEVSKFCGRSQGTILRWIKYGQIDGFIKVNDGYLFPETAVVKCFKKTVKEKTEPMTVGELAAKK